MSFCTIHPHLMYEKANHLLRIIHGELIKFSSKDLSLIERSFIDHSQYRLMNYLMYLQSSHVSIEAVCPHMKYDENDEFILENTTALDISNLHDFEKIHTYQYYYRDHRTLEDPKDINDYIKTLQINLHLLNKLAGSKVTSIDDITNGPLKKVIKMNEEIYSNQPNSDLVETLLNYYDNKDIYVFIESYILQLNEEENLGSILDYYIEILRECSTNKEGDRYIQILPKIEKIMNDHSDFIKIKIKCKLLSLSATVYAIRARFDESKKYMQFVGLKDVNSFDNLLLIEGEEVDAVVDKYLYHRDAILIYYNLYFIRCILLQQMGDIFGAFKSIVLSIKLYSMTEKDTLTYHHNTFLELFQVTISILQIDRNRTFDNNDDLPHSFHYCVEYFSYYIDKRIKMLLVKLIISFIINISNYYYVLKNIKKQ